MERDSRIREFLAPCRLVWQSGDPSPTNADALVGAVSGQAIVHTAAVPCVLPHGSSVVLDYGKELQGGIRLVTANNGPRVGRVRIRFGESVSEAMGVPDNDHAMHDTLIDVPWHGTADIGNTGFRFVRIDSVGEGATVELRAAPAVACYRDLPYRGSFRCSDERLNRIWDTAAYTVHLNMQDYVWDGIKRDRLVWLGDLHPEVRVICSVFPDDGVVPASLDLARDNTPLPGMINGISSYSLWWIIIQRDWYMHHGDLPYLREQGDYLTRLLRQMAATVGADGRESLPPGRFLDWPTSEDESVKHAGLQALLGWALAAGAELCGVLGDPACAALCRDARAKLLTHNPDAGMNKQANALKAIAGWEDPVEVNRRVLAQDPFAGLSTFYGYYVLQARGLAGDVRGALDVIRTYWGAMLDFGATTFWEDFDLAWTKNAGRIDEIPVAGKADLHADFGNYCYKGLRHSFCHGWAGGPAAWLTEFVLGVRSVAPGCRKITVTPDLGDLAWAEGTFPVPCGLVRVRHERTKTGAIETTVSAPETVDLAEGVASPA